MSEIELGSVIVTYNRLDYTQQTIESYLETIQVPHACVIIDNASTDGTKEYIKTLRKRGVDFRILNDKNLYAARARNQGIELLLEKYPRLKYIHFSDNDISYKRGWDRETIKISLWNRN